jgi:phenylacetaldehyde dehydrogenase
MDGDAPVDELVRESRRNLAAAPGELLVAGRWRPAASGALLDVHDPATGEPLARVAAGDERDIDDAVAAARAAFEAASWRLLPPSRRAALLLRLADLLERDVRALALLESLDAGHPVAGIERGDLALAIAHLRENAGWATRLAGELPPQGRGQVGLDYVVREPVGVVGIVTPWNAPLLMVVQKLAAALAAGCTAVVKPAELAPLTALRVGTLCLEAGFPPGVVNVVTGVGNVAGAALARHPGVDLVSFTGSTAVGKSLLVASGEGNLKRLLLELGGKSPVLVTADADLDRAAAAIAREIVFKSGQYCAAGTRVLVERAAHDGLLERLRARLEAVRIGPGTAPGTEMGPMISEPQVRRAEAMVAEAAAHGARVETGGRRRPGPGWFFEPTIVTGCGPSMRVLREEVFAPVLVLQPFDDGLDAAGVAALANDTRYGLSAKIWARSPRFVHDLVGRLQCGQVIVNGGSGGDAVLPFGGMKESGLGRENGLAGVQAYTELKSVRLGFAA